ncbi:glycoside hydrolase domain-containing protein [Virgibacillus sp. W0181]|uniref:glycoside hydrolase domain-containing protein n=1 Tax=Virgibacillus sp. W0181 TaxID=3391581 RepID=UPI003F47B570
MNLYRILLFIGIFSILLAGLYAYQENNQPVKPEEETPKEENTIYWGVDSASYTDEALYQCVEDNFGQPAIWGRYLGDKENVSKGLDQQEVELLHNKDVEILVIYNHFTDATGYEKGVKEAEQAIQFAADLDIPEGVAIFADIEPSYPVDTAFMEGWYDTVTDSNYEPAVYGVFDEASSLLDAFNNMNEEAQNNTVVWTAFPQAEITTKENAPDFNPQGPSDALLYGWQYAIEAEACNIDTNLFDGKIKQYMW